MRPDDIRNFLNKRPFQPFRITLTDGRSYEVRHPELVMVGRSSIVIGFPAPEESEPVADHCPNQIELVLATFDVGDIENKRTVDLKHFPKWIWIVGSSEAGIDAVHNW